jgi:hypothetical protein
MRSSILHKIPGSPFAAWESPAGTRGPRFTVIEPGAGTRGMARTRGTARTLAEAESLAAGLKPSTTDEILAEITPQDDRDRKRLAELRTLGQPGTRLWIICGDGTGYAAVSAGLGVSRIEAMFGDNPALDCWLIRWHDPQGDEHSGLYAVPIEDAERAWWVLNDAGRVVAGGPPIFDADRASEIASNLGGRAVLGVRDIRAVA